MAYGVDFALVAIIMFFAFFLLLVLYLRREDRREGYPLEEDGSGRVRGNGGLLFVAQPKTFKLADGGSYRVPNADRDTRPILARRTSVTPGSPIVPTGDAMSAGIGPGAYAQRSRVPDMTVHGLAKIVPMRVATDFSVVKGQSDPRGMKVYGADGRVAGTVSDIWVDRAESIIRYLEVSIDGGRSVLAPMTMSKINKSRGIVVVDAISAAQFGGVPTLESTDQITFYEEERVTAYYGAGFLYSNPSRAEPLL